MRAFALLVAFLIGFGSPAFADDVAAAQSVIRAQEQAFGRDDAAAAYSHAAPVIKQIFPEASIFMMMVQQAYPPVYRHSSFEFGEARAVDGQIAQRVHIVDANGEAWEGALYAGAAARRQPEDHGVFAVEGGPGGLGFHAIASRWRARINNSSMMAMLSAFHANPLANAAA